MLKNRIMIGAVAASAALVPIAGISALTAGPAGAAKPKGIICSKTSGKVDATTFSAKVSFSGCTGTTGTKGTTTASQTDTSQTVAWANGKSTTFSFTAGAGTACKPSSAKATLLADETENGNVTADTTKSTAVGAAVSGEFCVTENPTTGKIKLVGAPGVSFTIAK